MSYSTIKAMREAKAFLAWKAPVRVVAEVTVSPSGLATAIDGVTLAEGDRVLRTADGVNNGTWIASANDWRRAEDADDGIKLVLGSLIYVVEGTVRKGSVWRLDNTASITLNTDTPSYKLYAEADAARAFRVLNGQNEAVTLQAGDYCLYDTSGGSFAVTFPPAAEWEGRSIAIDNLTGSANALVLTPASGEEIMGGGVDTTLNVTNTAAKVCAISAGGEVRIWGDTA